ncbi:FAD-binding oxidoreductase [Balneolaceae bacterium YR4-1]|uniref:FAD-binding oxidoreductase n=1 Tax=Halalkalibaculum roseum TaxID=2709311 RepID=A0A6M1TBC6_9BACT|nr:FAD-dependent oxidoreductase [Halalkalibaculum roseum]NGP77433.1 FAD-binding oxidoreductase [Halalkalibaculum roseum]
MSSKFQYSFWEKETFLKPYDLIIIGAGIVGLSAALFTKRNHPSTRILVLDKGFMPEGASTRNAGFACVGSITEYIADLEKESAEGVKQRIVNRYRGLNLLKETLGENHIGYDACGGYELFTEEQPFEEASEYIPKFNKWMAELTGEEKVYKAGKLNGYHVIHNRLEGALHPGSMMQRLLQLVRAQDIEVKWNVKVEGVEQDGSVLLGNEIRLKADKVLVAANGFVKKLLPEVKVEPARGFVFVTNELEEMSWKGTFHHDRGYIYFRNISNRLLMGGARNIATIQETTDQFGVNEKIKDHLIKFSKDVLGLGKQWQIESEWSGIMGFTESKTPILERLDDHRFVAAGLSGMGVAIGTKIGSLAASMVMGKK